MDRILVLGAGSWGTTLANLLAKNSKDVTLWAREDYIADEINNSNSNESYLPGVRLENNLKATCESSELKQIDTWINTIPTQFIKDAYSDFNIDISTKKIINCSKGIEHKKHRLISEIFFNDFGLKEGNYGVLTGPSHAEEVSRNVPTTVVIASKNKELANSIQEIFSNPTFRVYTSEDFKGCELGGALKNIIAIAAGISDGLSLGDNPKAALLTRGLAEMKRLARNYGAEPMTFAGLAGLGDLIVTCNSKHSRNRSVGEKIARGKTLETIIQETNMIAEGVATTKSVYEIAQEKNVEMPITEQVYEVLYKSKSPIAGIKDLMSRTYKEEWW